MKTTIITFVLATGIILSACTGKKSGTADSLPATDTLKKMITARIFLQPEKVTAFINEARPMIDSSNAEPGCESYMLFQNPYDSTRFIFVEVWKDQAAIDNHFSMSYFKAFGPKTKDWLSQDTELKIVSIIPSN